MNNNQKGFSAVEVLVVIAILTIVGLIGHYVITRQNHLEPNESTTASQSTKNNSLSNTKEESAPQQSVNKKSIIEKEYNDDYDGEIRTISQLGVSFDFKVPNNWMFFEAYDELHEEYIVRVSDPARTYTLSLMIQPSISTSSVDTGNYPQEKSLVFSGVNGKKNYVVNTSVTEPNLDPQLFISICEIDFCHNIIKKDNYILNVHIARFDFYAATSISDRDMSPIDLDDSTIKQILAIVGTIKYQEK